MGKYKGLFETGRMEINDAPTVNEMKYFGRLSGSLKGMGGEYDDRVIGTGLAVLAWMRWIMPMLANQNQTYAIVSAAEANAKPQESSMILDFLKQRGVVMP